MVQMFFVDETVARRHLAHGYIVEARLVRKEIIRYSDSYSTEYRTDYVALGVRQLISVADLQSLTLEAEAGYDIDDYDYEAYLMYSLWVTS